MNPFCKCGDRLTNESVAESRRLNLPGHPRCRGCLFLIANPRATRPRKTAPAPVLRAVLPPVAAVPKIVKTVEFAPITPATLEPRPVAIIQRFQSGETQAAIGKSLGVSRQRVQQILKQNGITRQHKIAALIETPAAEIVIKRVAGPPVCVECNQECLVLVEDGRCGFCQLEFLDRRAAERPLCGNCEKPTFETALTDGLCIYCRPCQRCGGEKAKFATTFCRPCFRNRGQKSLVLTKVA